MNCTVLGLRLRAHPLLPLLLAAGALLGRGAGMVAALCALAVHEAGHLLAGKALGIPVTELEITPFGGVMRAEEADKAPPLRRFLFAAAGPAFSLLGCLGAGALFRAGLSFDAAQRLARCHLLLLTVNLLPALPLDGGEMLRAVLNRWFPDNRVTRLLSAAGYGTAALLGLLSLLAAVQGRLLLSPLLAGAYLAYAVAIQRRESVARYVTALIGRRMRLERCEALAVEWLAVGADTAAGTVLRALSPGKYHMLAVLSRDGMRSLGTVDEETLCQRALDDPGAPIGRDLPGSKKDGPAPNGV